MAQTASLVRVRIGKTIPSLKCKPGDTLEVSSEQAASFRERRMLWDQVQEDNGKKAAAKMVAETETDRPDSRLRSIIDDLQRQLKAEREKVVRLEKDIATVNAGAKALVKDNEELRAENAKLRKGKGLPDRQ